MSMIVAAAALLVAVLIGVELDERTTPLPPAAGQLALDLSVLDRNKSATRRRQQVQPAQSPRCTVGPLRPQAAS